MIGGVELNQGPEDEVVQAVPTWLKDEVLENMKGALGVNHEEVRD